MPMFVRRSATAVAAAAASAVIIGFTAGGLLEGLSVDFLYGLRHRFGEPPRAPSQVAVVAIDEETFRRPPFSDLPQVLWAPYLARVVDAVLEADPAAIGFDIVYAGSVESVARGYDKEFLLALRRGAKRNRVVLGRVQHQAKPLEPYPTYAFAVGGPKNIRALNVIADDDGVVRRLPYLLLIQSPQGGIGYEPSFSFELAARALGQPLTAPANGTVLLDFDTRAGAIPTYSLADLLACADSGRADYFRSAFAGRVVLVGTALDVEDRKLTSMRFATEPEGQAQSVRCALPVMTELYSGLRRDTLPGVYVHATAIDNILSGGGLRVLERWQATALSFTLALAGAAAAVFARPLLTGLGVGAGFVAWMAVGLTAFRSGLALPLLEGAAAVAVGTAMLLTYRVGIADRGKRRLARAFAYYLPQAEVDRLVRGEAAPELGGETREVTILFADIAGYTSLAERLSPAELVGGLNTYFSRATDIVERRGGFVDKFIGDAVLAVFGAPFKDPDHALHAVQAALDLIGGAGDGPALGGARIRLRVGVHSGKAVVGNIGGARRFNYTAIGDAVNLASRLEGTNKRYGTEVLVSEQTRSAVRSDEIVFREIDLVRVVGRAEPVTIFEPMLSGSENASASTHFAEALALLRAGQVQRAVSIWRELENRGDIVAARLAVIAASEPAPEDGITNLREK
jgi:adenylate cyclase